MEKFGFVWLWKRIEGSRFGIVLFTLIRGVMVKQGKVQDKSGTGKVG